MTKAEKVKIANEVVKDLGDSDPGCACHDCVAKRRATNLKLLPLLVAIMAEAGL